MTKGHPIYICFPFKIFLSENADFDTNVIDCLALNSSIFFR